MNAELFLLGKRISMASRRRRRLLVTLVYAGLATLIVGLYLIDRWRYCLVPLLLATMFVNRHFLGGELFGGLVKPFREKTRPSYDAETSIGHVLRWGFHRERKPAERDSRNDERELRQRDHAHYRAHQIISVVIFILWFVLVDKGGSLDFLTWLPIPTDQLVYGLVMVAWILSETMPQAILLWTEPDMESAEPAE